MPAALRAQMAGLKVREIVLSYPPANPGLGGQPPRPMQPPQIQPPQMQPLQMQPPQMQPPMIPPPMMQPPVMQPPLMQPPMMPPPQMQPPGMQPPQMPPPPTQPPMMQPPWMPPPPMQPPLGQPPPMQPPPMQPPAGAPPATSGQGASGGVTRPSFVLLVVPSKDSTGRAQRRPCPTASHAPTLEDGRPPAHCPYVAFAQHWGRRTAEVCSRQHTTGQPCVNHSFCAACDSEPLFTWPDGRVWTTADGTDLVRDLCVAIGEPANEFTGYSPRIGGASDLVEVLGPDRAAVVTKQRGRWRTDIHHVYERNSAADQLDASVLMFDASGRSLEIQLPGWNQPTRGWGGGRR